MNRRFSIIESGAVPVIVRCVEAWLGKAVRAGSPPSVNAGNYVGILNFEMNHWNGDLN